MSTRTREQRKQLRLILIVCGFLPTLLVVGFGIKTWSMLHDNGNGRDGFKRGDYDAAASDFRDNRSLNWVETWLAPFNEGASQHAAASYPEAITSYKKALESVPKDEECTVRINLALVHEVLGDESQEKGAPDAAVESWQEGVDVLAEGDCPDESGRGEEQTKDAAEVDKRLREKIEQNKQEQDPDQQPPPPPPPPKDPNEPQDPRKERLERNNKQGQSQRREDQEPFEDDNYSAPNAW